MNLKRPMWISPAKVINIHVEKEIGKKLRY